MRSFARKWTERKKHAAKAAPTHLVRNERRHPLVLCDPIKWLAAPLSLAPPPCPTPAAATSRKLCSICIEIRVESSRVDSPTIPTPQQQRKAVTKQKHHVPGERPFGAEESSSTPQRGSPVIISLLDDDDDDDDSNTKSNIDDSQNFSPIQTICKYLQDGNDVRQVLDWLGVPQDLPLIPSPRSGGNQYKGASQQQSNQSWQAYFYQNGSKFLLGHFATQQEAALVYTRTAWYVTTTTSQQQQMTVPVAMAESHSQPPPPPPPPRATTTKQPFQSNKKQRARGGKKSSPCSNPTSDKIGRFDCSQVPHNLTLIKSPIPQSKHKYKGVQPYKYGGKWKAMVKVPGKPADYLGIYLTEKDAALAYARVDFLLRRQKKEAETKSEQRRSKKRPSTINENNAGRQSSSSSSSSTQTKRTRMPRGAEANAPTMSENQVPVNKKYFLDDYDANDLALLLEDKGPKFFPIAKSVREYGIQGNFLLLTENLHQFLNAAGVVDKLVRFSIQCTLNGLPRRMGESSSSTNEARSNDHVAGYNMGSSSSRRNSRPIPPRVALKGGPQIDDDDDDDSDEGYQGFLV